MSDKEAKAEAAKVRSDFWEEFDKALAPDKCSKEAYIDELEELAAETEMCLEAVKSELREEGS